MAPLAFRALSGPAAVCAGGRRPARESSAPRASLGASSRSPARPRRRPPAPRQVPPAPSTPVVPGRCVCRWAAAFLLVLLVAPRVFRAPEGPAAREIATREPGGSECSISKPARALRSLRRPPHQWGWVADWCVVSKPGQAVLPVPLHTGASTLIGEPTINFAGNSPTTLSNHEF